MCWRRNSRSASSRPREAGKAHVLEAQQQVSIKQAAVKTGEAQVLEAQQQVSIKQAALKQAITTRDLAQLTFDRYQALLKQDFVAKQEVDEYRASLQNAKSAVAAAQANVDSALAGVTAAEQALQGDRANVESAQAGITAAEQALQGDQANVEFALAGVTAAEQALLGDRANVEAGKAEVAVAEAALRASQSAVAASQSAVAANQSAVAANQSAAGASQENARHSAVLTSFEKVTAPFDGVITARSVDIGSLVSAGGGAAAGSSARSAALAGSADTGTVTPATTPTGGLFGIAQTDVLRILVSVPAASARDVAPGLHVTVEFGHDLAGRVFTGTVALASGAVDAVSRTRLTEIHVDNHAGKILPGMWCQVHLALPHRQGVFRIPSGAITYDASGTRVVQVTPDNRLRFVPVEVTRDDGTFVEITGNLLENAMLVANPTPNLADGQRVNPMASPPS